MDIHNLRKDQETTRKRTLVLHYYCQGYKWTGGENAGIKAVLQPAIGRSNLFVEYMDTKKVFGDLYSQREIVYYGTAVYGVPLYLGGSEWLCQKISYVDCTQSVTSQY